jgi:hypothetical protein
MTKQVVLDAIKKAEEQIRDAELSLNLARLELRTLKLALLQKTT